MSNIRNYLFLSVSILMVRFFALCITVGGMFLLPILKHCSVKLHESLLDAETLKLALSRQ